MFILKDVTTKKIRWLLNHPLAPIIFLASVISLLYYKFFLFGQIPFPGDLLIGSYFPWLDYYKMPVKNPLISDVFSQFILWKYLAIESLRNLQWPLWNPYSFTGNPLLATYHSATLYPLNILLLLPKYYGWGLFIYSQTLIASLTFYLFVSQFIKSIIARLSGAIIFSLGGLMATWLELGTAVHGMSWLPLSLYAVKKFTDSSKYRFILLLITSLGLIILAGNAQVTTYSYTIIVLYFLWISWKDKLFFNKAFFLAVAIIFSISLIAAQLLPSYELLQKSIRQTESYSAEGNFGLLGSKDIFKFFIPDYFGNPVTRNYWGYLNYSETSGFLGIITLPLLIYSFFKVRGKQSAFFLILLGISLILIFDNAISHYLYQIKIPLLTSSYASRALFITILCSSFLASIALNHIFEKNNYAFFSKTLTWSWAAILGIILGTLLTSFFIWDILGWAPDEKYLKVYLNSNDYNLDNFKIATKNTLLPFILLSILSAVTLIKLKFKSIPLNKLNLVPLLLLLFITFDLGRYFLKFNPFVPNNLIFPKTPVLEFLQKQEGFFRVGREHAEVFPSNTWTAYNLYSYEGYDPIYLSQYGKFIHFLNGGDLRTGNSSRYAEISSRYSSPYLDAANTKYLVAVMRDENGYTPGDILHYKVKESGYNVVFKDKSTAVLENPKVKERAYFAKKIIPASEQNIKDIIMTDKSFDPRITVLLSKDLGVNGVDGKGTVQIVDYKANSVKIRTGSTSEQVLVLADQFEEGWAATLDGNQKLPISPANFIFRAVKIPAGDHVVVFNYLPQSFSLGLKISLVSVFLLTMGGVLAAYKKRF